MLHWQSATYRSAALQVYAGLVFLDLRPSASGKPTFQNLPLTHLPPLYLLRANAPSSSSRVHAPVHQRWKQGDEQVLDTVAKLAALAVEGRCVSYQHTLHCVPGQK